MDDIAVGGGDGMAPSMEAAPIPIEVVEVIDDSEEEEVFIVGQRSSSAPQPVRRSQDGPHMHHSSAPVPPSSMLLERNAAPAPLQGSGDLEEDRAAEGPAGVSPPRAGGRAPGPGPSAPLAEGVLAQEGGGAVAGAVGEGGGPGAAHGQGQGQPVSVQQEVAVSPGKREREEEAGTCTICFELFANSGAGQRCDRYLPEAATDPRVLCAWCPIGLASRVKWVK